MSYAQAVSFFTMGMLSNPERFGRAVDLYDAGQIEFMESVLPLAVAIERVYDAIEEHHDNCSVVWGYDILEPFGAWVVEFMSDPENCGCVPGQEAIDYLAPRLLEAFNVSNYPDKFAKQVAEAFRHGVGAI
ncbi:hypothetical protein [Pseudomonas phage UF_RH7]|nr:hypothetical protein [Pseudomonas phage UF_RH7]